MSGDAPASKGWSMFSGSPAGTPEKASRASADGGRPVFGMGMGVERTRSADHIHISSLGAQPRRGDKPLMTGSLWKERHTWRDSLFRKSMGEFYRYKLRFFALFKDPPRMSVWKDESGYYENFLHPIMTIPLEGSSLGTAQKHTNNPRSIGLFHPERDEVYLLCPDEEQFQLWIQALEGVLINPQQLGLKDFEILTLVGRGSFGKVLQVRKNDTRGIYALKILEKSHVKERAQVENTKSERRVLEIVNHPFIVKLHYAFQTGSALCLVMDFVNGGELFTYLKVHRTFHEGDARIWGAEILLALEYLHSMDLIYRDLKPENVLLSSQGHVKLTDFGLARDVNDELTAKTVAGSPYYMAPEVLLMKGHDTQADWWSLGILIYEMLTGLPPFYDDDAKKAYQKLLTCPIEFPATVSLAAQGLIRGLLAVDPAKRLGARLNAQEQQNQHKIIAASWGDGMPIKRHEWFKSLHWDEVLLQKTTPRMKVTVSSMMDVSNFDKAFTEDTTWKNHTTLSENNQYSPTADDDFGPNFNFVMRHDKDPRAKPMPVSDPNDLGGLAFRISLNKSSHGRTPSMSGMSGVNEPSENGITIPPWSCPPGREDDEFRVFRLGTPNAKEGIIKTTKKGMFNKYKTPRNRWVVLVPSLGAFLYFRKEGDLVPMGVFGVPPAQEIYPKRGVVEVKGSVFTCSIRVHAENKHYTLLCDNTQERDEWVLKLRTIGEKWANSEKRNSQVVGMERPFKGYPLIKSLLKTGHKCVWTAVTRGGDKIDILSEVGRDGDGHSWRYDGETRSGYRHGRGLYSHASGIRYYDGMWKSSERHGDAIVQYHDDGQSTGLYEGKYDRMHMRHGQGRHIWTNGDWYEGDWRDDKQHGRGIMFFKSSNEVHEGGFADGVPDGQGTRYYHNGEVYTGGWLKGNKHGVGVVKLPDSPTRIAMLGDSSMAEIEESISASNSSANLTHSASTGNGLNLMQQSILKRVHDSEMHRSGSTKRCIDGDILDEPITDAPSRTLSAVEELDTSQEINVDDAGSQGHSRPKSNKGSRVPSISSVSETMGENPPVNPFFPMEPVFLYEQNLEQALMHAYEVIEQKKKVKDQEQEREASGGDASVGEAHEAAQQSRDASMGDSEIDSDVESDPEDSQGDVMRGKGSFKDGSTADREANVCRMPRNQSKGQLGSMFLVNFPEGFELPPAPQSQPVPSVAPGGRQRSASYFHTPDDFCTLTPVIEESAHDKEGNSHSGSFSEVLPDVTTAQPSKPPLARASSGTGPGKFKMKRWHSSTE